LQGEYNVMPLSYLSSVLFLTLSGVFRELDNNAITTLALDVFDPLTSLEELYLQNNELSHFPALQSPPLMYIDLSSNNIETIAEDAFSYLASLFDL